MDSDTIVDSYKKLHDLPNDPVVPTAVIFEEPVATTTVVEPDEPSPLQVSPSQKWLTPFLVGLAIQAVSLLAYATIATRYLAYSQTRKTAEHENCLATTMQNPCQACTDGLHQCNADARKAREGAVIGLDWVDIATIIVLAFLWLASVTALEKWLVARISR